MAWLQGLAGKAESLLNRMDQTAADTIQSTTSSSSELADKVFGVVTQHRKSSSSISTHSETAFGVGHRSLPEEAWKNLDDPSGDSSIRRASSHQDFAPSRASPSFSVDRSPRKKRNAKNKDDELLNFLNAEEPDSARSREEAMGNSELEFAQRSSSQQDDMLLKSEDDRTKASTLQDTSAVPREAVYRENQLLKSELQGLRRESSMALSRAKRAEQDLEKLLNQVSMERSKNAADNNAREADFMNALKAKDSQTAVLRVKLEQMETECSTLQNKLTESDVVVSRLRREQIEHGSQNVQIESTRRRVIELDGLLSREKETATHQQNQLAATIKTLEDQKRELLSTVGFLEKNVAAEKSSKEEVHKQMSLALLDCDLARQELVDYQQKAHKILQSKDEVIASLKASNGVIDNETANTEAQERELEKEMLRTEVVNLQTRIETSTKQLHESESQYRQDASAFREQLIAMERRLSDEHLRREELETSLRTQSEETRYLQVESSKREQVLQARLKDREEELVKVRQQFFARSESRPSEEELESRMRVLTDNLIQKQTLIETLNTEKNSMVVQMERLERRLREATRPGAGDSLITVMPSSGEGGNRSALPLFTESASDNEVARRFKRVYSTVDRFSFRLGTFLRRYPLARVMVIAYMFLLHFWVLLVLLTYTPEIHDSKPAKR